MGMMKDIPREQKPAFGQKANAVRQKIEGAFTDAKSNLGATPAATGGPMLDITEPGLPPRMGRQHIITQTINELTEVFGRMGFDIATGPEVEDEHHNFIALNIPESHPARDPVDNFYLTDPNGDNPSLLRSQTSTIQIRVMEQTRPPVRVVATGRVYRPDEHDATHYSMFHQVEGLYVDRNVSLVDLKTTLVQFVHAMFGPDADVRLLPSYFPFTEPSAELYLKIELGGELQWIEVGGCGMVDPAVFEAVGYDPEEWTGFAFGLGIERLAMRKYGISDIRWLFENDVRFLRQF
jgi:phenylalanyl-tRNA synthetase alpha chain